MFSNIDAVVSEFVDTSPARLRARPGLWLMSAVASMCGVALALRLAGIGFGLPYEYHPDEVQYVRQAASMGTRGLEPTWWNDPPFYKYLLFAEDITFFGIGKLTGRFTSSADFGTQLKLDPTPLYLLGRGTSAVMGALTLLLVYASGATAFSRLVGVLGALFWATSFLAVREAHFAVNDATLTFCTTLVLLAAVRVARTPDRRWYVVAGIGLGVGFATKYSALVGIVPFGIAFLISSGRNWRSLVNHLPNVALAGSVACMAAIAASPYFAATPGKVINDAYESLYVPGREGFNGWEISNLGGYLYYADTLRWGLGWGMLLFSLAGVCMVLTRPSRTGLVVLSLPLSMYLFMGQEQMYFGRFILPAIPPLVVLAGAVVLKVGQCLPQKRVRALVVVTLGCLLVGPGLMTSLRFDTLLETRDTRTLAKNWIESNVASGAKIATDWDFFGPPLASSSLPVADSNRTFDVEIEEGKGLPDHELNWYVEQGFDYLVVSSYISDVRVLDPDAQEERDRFYRSLDDQLRPIKVIAPRSDGADAPFVYDEVYGPAVSTWHRDRPGPTLKIYAIAPLRSAH